jgi:hypothetical protein
VDVYAKRGDFDTAETVLEAGGRNATDMSPVYRGITEVLSRRELLRPAFDAGEGEGDAAEAGDVARVEPAPEGDDE